MTAKDCTLTQEEVKRLLSYDKDTGLLRWRIFKAANACVGDVAGWITTNRCKKYKRIGINKKQYYVHRIIWLYVYGYFPIEVDHIDGCGTNNKIKNLREVTHLENNKNKRLRKGNKSGVNGVVFITESRKWQARLMINYKNVSLGFYTDWFDAVCARKSSEYKYGFHENHGKDRPL